MHRCIDLATMHDIHGTQPYIGATLCEADEMRKAGDGARGSERTLGKRTCIGQANLHWASERALGKRTQVNIMVSFRINYRTG